MRYSIEMCCRRRKRDHEIITKILRNYRKDRKKNSPKIDRQKKKPMTLCEKISYRYSVSRAAFLYFLQNIESFSKKTSKSRQGKKSKTQREANASNLKHQAVSPFRSSLSRESEKIKKINKKKGAQKKKKEKKKKMWSARHAEPSLGPNPRSE